MLKKIGEHRTKVREARAATRRHKIAMRAAWDAYYTLCGPTPEDVINLAYGAHGIRLTDDEARDALAAELARHGHRLEAPSVGVVAEQD